jgi:hypothetical protein
MATRLKVLSIDSRQREKEKEVGDTVIKSAFQIHQQSNIFSNFSIKIDYSSLEKYVYHAPVAEPSLPVR